MLKSRVGPEEGRPQGSLRLTRLILRSYPVDLGYDKQLQGGF